MLLEPVLMGFHRESPHQPQTAVAIREDAHDMGPPLDLLVQARRRKSWPLDHDRQTYPGSDNQPTVRSSLSYYTINQRLDASLAQFADRPLAEAFPYLILDARYERVREAGVIVSQAVLIAIGIDWDGRRQVLAVELANRESRSSWRDFLLGLK